ncbi:Brp/Blh family beta-carotene 15,15'-dioxygenase [Flavobacterium sp.]|uniref:Brp/Blh family beta-carotene 15,15'-dioxygenase n=1 Tax=Flavobacterium sp. TaxID=239 RepID=UPI002B4AAEAF|nr:Brp/Blh family beta-carotene 15,15'-dioxygenase [Flavobacterium sp.]HLP64623.1 Brp/Blh family beta-carotene 15,15'-dioxygenase [Flavobacterium sp.]
MLNTNSYRILFSFFAIWITSNFSFKYQQLIGFVVIFLFGILHGANDLALFQKINENKVYLSIKKMIIYYILIVSIGALLFFYIPIFALLLFILFSSYHFGEQHWNELEIVNQNQILVLFQTVYGLFILSLLFSFHEIEVKNIIQQISNTSIAELNFKIIISIVGLILLILGIVMYRISKKFKSEIVLNLFYLLVFAIIFKTADLIWAFAIYFVVWHSIPSMKEQIHFLYGDCTVTNFKRYFKSAFLYWIASLIGIGILYMLFKEYKIFNALFFSFLAAITFPHTLIIIKMQNRA